MENLTNYMQDIRFLPAINLLGLILTALWSGDPFWEGSLTSACDLKCCKKTKGCQIPFLTAFINQNRPIGAGRQYPKGQVVLPHAPV